MKSATKHMIDIFTQTFIKWLLCPGHCVQELEIKDIIGIRLTVTLEDLYKKRNYPNRRHILLVKQDINRPLQVNDCIYRMVIYQPNKRYAQLSLFLQFGSIYCWIQKHSFFCVSFSLLFSHQLQWKTNARPLHRKSLYTARAGERN